MRLLRPFALVALIVTPVLVGCAPVEPTEEETTPSAPTAAVNTTPASTENSDCCCDGIVPAEPTSVSQNRNVAPASNIPPKIRLQAVKYQGFVAALMAHKGKIVVVDFWGAFCVPCKREFPHLVDLHRKYAGDGVVCISATVDEKKNVPAALAFLQSQGATFDNYWLDEDFQLLTSKLGLSSVPAVFVYDRAGQRVATFDEDGDKPFSYADVEKRVVQLLAQ
ncbi:MAG TPA: TlpA disulfide reductase family protein, partial [Gemmataceae bacterium]|nr:TlpA disulfide reductase family protein [Gemmataceae bacterium]